MDGKNEVELRRRLFEVERAMDETRLDPEATGRLAKLAAERDEIRGELGALVPEGVELGYQGGERPFTKADQDGEFIPQIGETGLA